MAEDSHVLTDHPHYCSVDVESTREFEKEGSKEHRITKVTSQDPRTGDGMKQGERESVCVCMAMGWRCVSRLILLAGESGRDENEIRRKRGKHNATGGTSWPCPGDTRGVVASSSRCCARIFISGLVTINNLD